MFSSLSLAIGQLPDPRFRRVLIRGLAFTFLLYALLYLAAGWGLSQLQLFDIGWLNATIGVLGGVGGFFISLLLFPTMAVMVMGLLLDDVVQAVEDKHYPGLPPPRNMGAWEMIRGSVRFAAMALLINCVAMPFYLALIFIGFGVVLFYLVNGYLLSREYFEMVAQRRLPPAEADALRRANRMKLWAFGAVLTFLSTVPLVNLFAPLISTAAMTHEFWKISGGKNGPGVSRS